MKFKKLMILGMLGVLVQSAFAQSKLQGNVMVSGGLARSDMYNKIFVMDVTTANGPLYPRTQTAETFLDFNAIYFFKKNVWKLKPVVGFGYSPQGFLEKGLVRNDSQKIVDYFVHVSMSYINIPVGFSYKIISNNSINLKFIQTINPMLNIGKSNSVFQKFAVSTRSSILLDIKFKNGGVACISPFFQTSIMKFNKTKKVAESPDYYPYSYGINIGTYFKH